MRNQKVAGYKAAYTRKIQKLDEDVRQGAMTIQQAAGYKAHAKRRLNEQVKASQ